MKAKKKSKGFTLIEVLVALGIVAIALFAGTQATGALSRSAQRQSDLLLAQICADNEMVKIRLAKQMPPVGDDEQPCSQGGRELSVKRNVRPTPNPSFMRVQVNVLDKAQNAGILQVTTVVGRF